MKVRLLEDAHKTWAPAGTVGELENCGIWDPVYRFKPDSLEYGIWIGRVKWEAITDESKADVKRRGRR